MLSCTCLKEHNLLHPLGVRGVCCSQGRDFKGAKPKPSAKSGESRVSLVQLLLFSHLTTFRAVLQPFCRVRFPFLVPIADLVKQLCLGHQWGQGLSLLLSRAPKGTGTALSHSDHLSKICQHLGKLTLGVLNGKPSKSRP